MSNLRNEEMFPLNLIAHIAHLMPLDVAAAFLHLFFCHHNNLGGIRAAW